MRALERAEKMCEEIRFVRRQHKRPPTKKFHHANVLLIDKYFSKI